MYPQENLYFLKRENLIKCKFCDFLTEYNYKVSKQLCEGHVKTKYYIKSKECIIKKNFLGCSILKQHIDYL